MKHPNVKERLMSERILIGGEVVTRSEAVTMLQSEGVDARAIDMCVFGVKPLTEQELLQVARNELMFTLYLHTQ